MSSGLGTGKPPTFFYSVLEDLKLQFIHGDRLDQLIWLIFSLYRTDLQDRLYGKLNQVEILSDSFNSDTALEKLT